MRSQATTPEPEPGAAMSEIEGNERGFLMRNKRLIVVLAVVLVGASLVVARATTSAKPKEEEPPFRLGKVQAEDLQVSVREVGVVDPEIKVEVKSTVSGRVLGLRVREGDTVAAGDVLAEVEPDVNQAQSLSDVKSAVGTAELRLREAERDLAAQKSLYDNGLIGSEQLRSYQAARDIAADTLLTSRTRYQIVEDRGIPISGDASTQKARVTAPMASMMAAEAEATDR